MPSENACTYCGEPTTGATNPAGAPCCDDCTPLVQVDDDRDPGGDITECASLEAALDNVETWALDIYPDVETSTPIEISVRWWGGDASSRTVVKHPNEPACVREDDDCDEAGDEDSPEGHRWREPAYIFGEFRGVSGSNHGGTEQRSACLFCGCGRAIDNGGTNRQNGTRMTTVVYTPGAYDVSRSIEARRANRAG